jgi:hypothetical protein
MQAGGINLFGVVADSIDASVSIKRTRRTVMPSVLSNRALRIALRHRAHPVQSRDMRSATLNPTDAGRNTWIFSWRSRGPVNLNRKNEVSRSRDRVKKSRGVGTSDGGSGTPTVRIRVGLSHCDLGCAGCPFTVRWHSELSNAVEGFWNPVSIESVAPEAIEMFGLVWTGRRDEFYIERMSFCVSVWSGPFLWVGVRVMYPHSVMWIHSSGLAGQR